MFYVAASGSEPVLSDAGTAYCMCMTHLCSQVIYNAIDVVRNRRIHFLRIIHSFQIRRALSNIFCVVVGSPKTNEYFAP